MDRVDQLRQARSSPHVIYMEYMKLRSKSDGLFIIFEGKQCPTIYINWLRQLLVQCNKICGQIIARGKKNALALRDLINKNPLTANDKNLYFVDRDYDIEPKPDSFPDIYVTRGYAIENEVVGWSVVDSFIRAYFDIADCDDHESLELARVQFETGFTSYLQQTKDLHRIIYICRTKGIDCLPGDSALSFVKIDWITGVTQPAHNSIGAILSALKIETSKHPEIISALAEADGFMALNPVADWRGKFHFSIVRSFLNHLKQTRLDGTPPFKRSAKLNADPANPALIGLLGSVAPYPPCLAKFMARCNAA